MKQIKQKRLKILTRQKIWKLNQNHLFLKKIPNNFSKSPKSTNFFSQYGKLCYSYSSGNSVICQENAKGGNTEML